MTAQHLDLEGMRTRLVEQHGDLPPQLKRISQFVLDNPEQAALMRIADISQELGVQPSSVIRFSKAVGFKGFSHIQRILRADLRGNFPQNYFDRLKGAPKPDTQGTLGRFAALAQQSLANLPDMGSFDAAINMLCAGHTIHIMGLRRAFGVASYFSYLLASFDARVNQIQFLGHMRDAALSTVRGGDVLLLISFPNYSTETQEAMSLARERGVKTIVITDSKVSPVAKDADLTLLTDQATDGGFRSAAGCMVTVQALAMAFGERQAQASNHAPSSANHIS